jgi:hypothetical protein
LTAFRRKSAEYYDSSSQAYRFFSSSLSLERGNHRATLIFIFIAEKAEIHEKNNIFMAHLLH